MTKIIDILKTIRPEANFENSQNFFEDDLIDSLDLIQAIDEIEKQFQISIDGQDISPENFESISSLENLIKKYQN